MISLDLSPRGEVLICLSKGDSTLDVILSIFIVIFLKIEIFEMLLKLLFGWVANSFCLLDKVIDNSCSASLVQLIGIFVHDYLVSPLVIDSLSHVFVSLQSDRLLNELLNDCDEIIISLISLILIVLLLLKLALEIEQLEDVVVSDNFEVLVNLALELFWITILIGLWE